MLKSVTTSDLYESSLYVLGGCELKSIEGYQVTGKVNCKLTFEGENIDSLQIEYFHGKATVNLLEFRRTYNQVNKWVSVAKRQFKKELREGGRVYP